MLKLSTRIRSSLLLLIALSSAGCVTIDRSNFTDFLGATAQINVHESVDLSTVALHCVGEGQTQITANKPEIWGELLALDTEGYLIVCHKDDYNFRLARVHYAVVNRARFPTQTGTIIFRKPPREYQETDPEKYQHIRLWSRYPQGVSPALLEKLLAAYQQDALIEIK